MFTAVPGLAEGHSHATAYTCFHHNTHRKGGGGGEGGFEGNSHQLRGMGGHWCLQAAKRLWGGCGHWCFAGRGRPNSEAFKTKGEGN